LRRLIEHRRHVYDGVLLGVGQARLQLVDDLVQPQPLVDELGVEAAELGVLGRLPEAPVAARNVGYVFQDPTLLPWRSVRRNVELLGELHWVPKPERRAVAEAAIAAVGLTGFEDKYPRALSGGMKMRASLARALTMSPDVFPLRRAFRGRR
jgi:ABC-type nitrate/sulfonate/bicarbonate transport system ATPase subunit